MSADIGSCNTAPTVLPQMSDIRYVAAVATACGGSSYTTKDTGTATATTASPAATEATGAPAAAGGDYLRRTTHGVAGRNCQRHQ